MPRIHDPIRSRKGGGTMGVSSAPGGFYQRRNTEDKPYWPGLPEEEKEGVSEKQTAVGSPAKTTTTTTETDNSAAVPADKSQSEKEAMRARFMLNKKKKMRKKKRLSTETVLEDEGFSLNKTKPQHHLQPPPKESATPRVISNSHAQKQEFPMVTPASSVADPEHLPQSSPPQRTSPSKEKPENREMELSHSQQEEPWKSPHPHASAAPPKNDESFLAIELRSLKEKHRLELEQQKQQYEASIQQVNSQCREKDETIKQLHEQQQHKDKQHTADLQDAVQQEHTRVKFQFDQDKRRHMQQISDLEHQVDEAKKEMESKYWESLQINAGHSLRMRMMAQTVLDLSRGHTESQQECEQLRGELEETKKSLADAQRQIMEQQQQKLALEQWEQNLKSREGALAQREANLGIMQSFPDQASSSHQQQFRNGTYQGVNHQGSNGEYLQQQNFQPQQFQFQQQQQPYHSAQLQQNSPQGATGFSPPRISRGDLSFHSPGSANHTETVGSNPVPRGRRSPRKRRLRDVIPSYDFCADLNIPVTRAKNPKKPKIVIDP